MTSRPDMCLDWIVSVDDHVIEPPGVWLDRVPKKYADVAPRMEETDRGAVWRFEDKVIATSGLSVAAGKKRDEVNPEPLPFDAMRPESLLGADVQGGRGDRAGDLHARGVIVADGVRLLERTRARQPGARSQPHRGGDALVALQRRLRSYAQPQDRPLRGQHR